MSKEDKIEVKKQENPIVPDQLNIIIRTSIPGHQQIIYKPSMTIKNIDSKGVQFNPLIKLNKSKIDSIPEDYRIKEFFNKGLFQSLLNYNGALPAKTLTYATANGYVDNNIKVTLDTIFPVNSVIYIDKKPYAIADTQWTKGDWKIEIKQKKEEIDPYKVTDPQLYTQLIRNEIISGEEQLENLPKTVIVGMNYSGTDVASGIKPQPILQTQTEKKPESLPVKKDLGVPVQTLSPNIIQSSDKKPLLAITPSIGTLPPAGTQESKIITTSNESVTKPKSQFLPSSEQFLTLPAPTNIEELSHEEEKLFNTFKETIKINMKHSLEFINHFKKNTYYFIANLIYINFNFNIKKIIVDFYKFTTQPQKYKDSLNLSRKMYNDLCEQVKIIESPSDGDCFFYAVATGINIYNYENQSNKIYYNNYGKTQLFTINILREIVLRYYQNLDKDTKDTLMNIGMANVTELNDKFKKSIEENFPQTNEEYIERLNTIYISNENFFVYNPMSIPIEVTKYNSPFTLIKEGQISNYIKSKKYWGDQFSMQAICHILNIYIIPIQKDGSKKLYTLLASLPEQDRIKEICSSKILYLYKKNLHYELIRFKYLKQILDESSINKKLLNVSKYYTIFKTDDMPPPFHIFILIYGSNYLQVDNENKENYGIYKNIMKMIETSVIKILKLNTNTKIVSTFIRSFNGLFLLKKSLEDYFNITQIKNNSPTYISDGNEYIEEPKINDIKDVKSGGQPQYRYPQSPYGYPQSPYRYPQSPYGYPQSPYGYPQSPYRYPQSPYRYPPYQNKFITKKPEDRDSSKIAYLITIDMEVHPGTSLTSEQINESKCNSKYNAIRKSISELTGKPYIIPPIYKQNKDKSINTNEAKFNNTRKNIGQSKAISGGKRNITIKTR
jgi:hypothetical protein